MLIGKEVSFSSSMGLFVINLKFERAKIQNYPSVVVGCVCLIIALIERRSFMDN
jgi:hypothetical protein